MKILGAKTFDAPSLDQFRGFTLNGENDTAVCRALQTAETNLIFSPDKQHTQDWEAIGHFKNVYDLQDGGAIAQAAKQEYCEEIAAIIREAATVEVDGKAPVQTVSAQGISNGLDNIATNSDKARATKAQLYMSTEAAARNLTEYHKALLEKKAWDESKTVASQLVALQDFRESTGTQVGGDTHNAYVTLVEQKALEVQKGALLDEKAPPLLARDVNARVEQMNRNYINADVQALAVDLIRTPDMVIPSTESPYKVAEARELVPKMESALTLIHSNKQTTKILVNANIPSQVNVAFYKNKVLEGLSRETVDELAGIVGKRSDEAFRAELEAERAAHKALYPSREAAIVGKELDKRNQELRYISESALKVDINSPESQKISAIIRENSLPRDNPSKDVLDQGVEADLTQEFAIYAKTSATSRQ
jgi:hypothetical protein